MGSRLHIPPPLCPEETLEVLWVTCSLTASRRPSTVTHYQVPAVPSPVVMSGHQTEAKPSVLHLPAVWSRGITDPLCWENIPALVGSPAVSLEISLGPLQTHSK